MNNATAKPTFLIPAIVSFFIPGAGQLLKRQWWRAGTFWALALVAAILLFMLSMPPVIGQACLFALWVWQVYDTYTSQEDWK